jgi:hypothetical protein
LTLPAARLHRAIVDRNEVYLRVERDVRQPLRKTVNLDQDLEDIRAEAERLLSDSGPAYQPRPATAHDPSRRIRPATRPNPPLTTDRAGKYPGRKDHDMPMDDVPHAPDRAAGERLRVLVPPAAGRRDS